MAPQVKRGVPPYKQIADGIEARIVAGELRDGDSIPSARQIAADWDVALATATKAHAELRSRGLVKAETGVGTVVSLRRGTHGAQERVASSGSGRVYGAGEIATITSAESVPAPPHVAVAMGIGEGDVVIRRERVTRLDGTPVSVSTSWLPGRLAALAPELLVPERVLNGTFQLAADRAGLTVTSGREEAAASTADDTSAAALDVEPGTPVMLARNWFRDQNGDVIEYGESVRRPDRWTVHEFSMR